jgi:hypothetical protein
LGYTKNRQHLRKIDNSVKVKRAFRVPVTGIGMKGEIALGSPIQDKNQQVTFLKHRLNMFMDVLDAIDPEEAELEDIDRLIEMIDELESKCREFNNREE